MLKVEIHSGEIPEVFARFRDAIGERHWQRRVKLLKDEIRGNRFLRNYLREENEIAFALAGCSDLVTRYRDAPHHEIEKRALYPAIGFAAQALSIIDRSSAKQAKQLVRRIHGALKNPDEMRAIRLELLAATHFARRGHKFTWPEMEGDGRFDLLIEDIGFDGLEIECKSVSEDKGRRIHRREAIEFYKLVWRDFERVRRNLQSDLAVVLTVPSRLPTLYDQRRELSQRVISAVNSAESAVFDDGVQVRISEFDKEVLGNIGSEGLPIIDRVSIDQVTATENREVMILGGRAGGAIVLALQSADEDSLLKYVFDTLSQAAKNQVTGTRPALLLAGFDGLAPQALLDIAKQDLTPEQPPTGLRVRASKFLEAQDRDHIVGVGFLSRSALALKLHGEVDSGGSAYIFPRRESRFWHKDFSGLFSDRSTSIAE